MKTQASLSRPLFVPKHTQAENALEKQGTPDFVPSVVLNTNTLLEIWDLGAEGYSCKQSAVKRKLRG